MSRAVEPPNAVQAEQPRAVRVHCTHCRLVVPPALVEPGASEQYCCHGCRTVRETLRGAGLADGFDGVYNRFATERVSARSSGRSFEAFDRDAFREEHVESEHGGALARVEFLLEGVHCAACVWLVERLGRLEEGVVESNLMLRDARVCVRFDPERTSPARIARALDRLGYTPHPARADAARERARAQERRHLMRMGAAAVCAGNAMLVAFALYSSETAGAGAEAIDASYRSLFLWTGVALGWLSILWPGRVFLQGAWSAFRARRSSLDLPIAIALVAGALAGTWSVAFGGGESYFDSLSILVFLLLVGRYVQAREQRFASDAVDLTRALTASTARIERDGEEYEVGVSELRTGDITVVRAGEPFPSDGLVVSGRSSVDTSLLTGESDPGPVGPGERVLAGTQNIAGPLRVRVTECGAETRAGKLMELVGKGLHSKPPIERFTDRVAGLFVTVVCGLAAATFAWWAGVEGDALAAVENTVALLIVACPCALGLATPLTLAVAVGRAARRGVLVKDAAAFERLARHGTFLFDKTGTLTRGALRVVNWGGDESVRGAVATLESSSSHPVGAALARDFADEAAQGVRAEEVVERLDGGIAGLVDQASIAVGSPRWMRGRGVEIGGELELRIREAEARGETVVGVTRDGDLVAAVSLADAVRSDASDVLHRLRSCGFDVEVLSGDGMGAVERVASELGVDRASGAVEPEAKLARVLALQAKGDRAIMVGDGVNDAAALAAADVGIAVRGGAEVSLAAADVYVSKDGLTPIADLVRLSRRTMRTIRCNLALSLVYNVVGVTCAALGLMSPLFAAVLMPLSSISVLALALVLVGVERRGPTAEPDSASRNNMSITPRFS